MEKLIDLAKRNKIADQFPLIMKQKLDEEPRTPFLTLNSKEVVSMQSNLFLKILKRNI